MKAKKEKRTCFIMFSRRLRENGRLVNVGREFFRLHNKAFIMLEVYMQKSQIIYFADVRLKIIHIFHK